MRFIFGQWPFVFKNSCRYSDHGAARGRLFEDNSAGAHDGLFAECSAREHGGADSNVSERADAHSSTEHSPRRDMNVRIDSAVVLDYRSGVDNAIFADHRVCVDDRSRHYHGSVADLCRWRNDGGCVNKSCRREPIFERSVETPGACAVITNGNDESAANKTRQLLHPTDGRAIAERETGFRRVVIQECDALETSGTAGDVQNDLSVPPSAPDQ
jgi:hypothetical protein